MIFGKKCVLTPMTQKDISITLEWVNDPEYRYWNGTVFPISEFEHYDFIINKVKSPYEKIFMVKKRDDMGSIGFVGIKDADVINKNCEIYGSIGRLDAEYLEVPGSTVNIGKGYGTEAFYLLSEFCLYELNLHKVYSKVYAYNDRSYKSFIKAGFSEEARLKEHHFVHGKYADLIIMSKRKD